MAEYTQTISEDINIFGVAPSNKWNEYNWNAFLWGEGTNKAVTKTSALLSDSTAITDGAPQKIDSKVSDSIVPTSNMSSETLQESKSWFYVTPSNDTNYESRDIASFTSGTLPGSTYSSQAAGSTSWT